VLSRELWRGHGAGFEQVLRPHGEGGSLLIAGGSEAIGYSVTREKRLDPLRMLRDRFQRPVGASALPCLVERGAGALRLGVDLREGMVEEALDPIDMTMDEIAAALLDRREIVAGAGSGGGTRPRFGVVSLGEDQVARSLRCQERPESLGVRRIVSTASLIPCSAAVRKCLLAAAGS
jgi:hypothetical protein